MAKKRRPKKKIFSKIIRFFLTILLVIVLFFNFFNFNYFKPRIENELTKALGQSVKIKGNIKLGLAGWRPALALYRIKIGKTVKADKFEISPAITKPVDDSLWKFFIEVNNLSINKIDLGDYYAPVSLYLGGFDIPKLSGKLGRARLKGKFKFINGKLAVKADLNKFPYNRVVEGMKGNAKLSLSLKAKGKNIDSIIKTLQGRVILIGGKGKIKSDALKLWTTDFLKAMFSGKKDFIELSCLVTDFNIKSGVASGKSIFLDTKEMTIIGKGGVNLITKKLNFKLTPKLKKTSLINVALPVKVSGYINNPKVAPEVGGLAKTIGTLLLSTINPAVVLIPLVTGGHVDKNPCKAYLD